MKDAAPYDQQDADLLFQCLDEGLKKWTKLRGAKNGG